MSRLHPMAISALVAALAAIDPPEPPRGHYKYVPTLELVPPPNPKADKRKANRVKQMQERKLRRKAVSGKKP